ncbi:MAG: hypothetical protein BWK79_08880, partial [Beggiatoa sp. IS2]
MTQLLIHQIASNESLDTAYQWLCEHHTETRLPAWETLKPQLQTQLLSGKYCFQPVTLVHTTNRLGESETQEIWQTPDQLVLKALSLVLKEHLKQDFSSCCHHLEGRGGIKKAVRKTRDYVQTHPQSWVLKTDVLGYYAHLDHFILHQQFCALLPEEKYLQRLIWQYLKRSIYDGGNYYDIERGISLGCPLSPLMAALYLKPLDDLFADHDLFYARFMDDFVVIASTRWGLQKVITEIASILDNLKLENASDKTFIGRVERQFDFLGYQFSPTALTVAQKTLQRRDMRIVRLYEHSSKAVIPAPANIQIAPQLLDSHLRGNDKRHTNERVQSARYSFEAKLLALGSASLLATTATDSHANSHAKIHLVLNPVNVAPPNPYWEFDLNTNNVLDLIAFISSNPSNKFLGFLGYPPASFVNCPWAGNVGGPSACVLSFERSTPANTTLIPSDFLGWGGDGKTHIVRFAFPTNPSEGLWTPLHAWIMVKDISLSPPNISIVCYAYQDDGSSIAAGMSETGPVNPNTCELEKKKKPPPPPET